jgi:hypothetical protein
VVGSGAVLHATRASGASTVPSHCSKGYPCSRVLTISFTPIRYKTEALGSKIGGEDLTNEGVRST